MRELKYRVWGVDINGEGERKMWFVPDIRDTDTSRRVFSELEDNDVMELNPWMQYTGLKDKNGVEIYEGDIVKDNIFGLYTVFFSYGGFKLIGVNELSNQLALMDSHSNWYEVIGNIYENPELLEANQ